MKVITSYIAPDVQIDGKITCTGPVRIDGFFEGNLESEYEVIIGTRGRIHGKVHANGLRVNGKVKGDLISKSKIVLLEDANLVGDVYSPAGCISITAGGILDGSFHITSPSPESTVNSSKS